MAVTGPAEITAMAEAMRRAAVARVVVGDITIEMHPSAFTQTPAAAPVEHPDDDVCKCGHSIGVEHNEAGCLKGCALEQCVPSEGDE